MQEGPCRPVVTCPVCAHTYLPPIYRMHRCLSIRPSFFFSSPWFYTALREVKKKTKKRRDFISMASRLSEVFSHSSFLSIWKKKENIKIKVFIYGLPAGGDSLTSQSLARRKCLLMGRLSGPVPIGIHLSFSTDLANSFLLGMHLPSCFSPSSIARPLCWPSCPSKVLLTRLHYWQAQDSAGGPWWAGSADFHSVPLFLLLFIVSNSIFHVYLLREWEMIYSVPRH